MVPTPRKGPVKISSAHDLGVAVRSRRQSLGLTQTDLAARAGVSRPWLHKVETGQPSIEFGLVIRLLETLGLVLDLTDSGDGGTGTTRASVDLDALLSDYRDR